MSSMTGFITAITIATTIGTAMIAVFRRPIRTMLGEACATEARSRFWSTYLCALFILVPLVAASVFAVFTSRHADPAILVEGTFLFAASGLLGALIIIGRNITSSLGPMVSPATSNGAGDKRPDPAEAGANMS